MSQMLSQATINIRIDGRHASIRNFAWQDIPPLAVVTGLNGAGKSQLLEAVAAEFGALHDSRTGTRDPLTAKARVTGMRLEAGEVFHNYGEWPAIKDDSVSEDQVALKGRIDMDAPV